MSAGSDGPDIEVVLALPRRCWRVPLRVPAGTAVGEAVRASGLDRVCREQTGAEPAAIGIHGRKVGADQVVNDGDRIELYRPLTHDPRARRRERARQPDKR